MRWVSLVLCLIVAVVGALGPVQSAYAGEGLTATARAFDEAASKTDQARQKKSLENAASAARAAAEALEKGDEQTAKKEKKKALKWATWSIRYCMSPKDVPDEGLLDALKKEGHFGREEVEQYQRLVELVVRGKKKKEESDFPVAQEMALQQLMLALQDMIDTGGFDGWRPEKALRWYLSDAEMCEDVQDIIERILDYMRKNADETGIPDMTQESYKKAKEMVEKLYEMKAAGASKEDISDIADKIRALLEEEGTRVGRMRKQKDLRESDQADSQSEDVATDTPSATTVCFTALDGQTAVNKNFIGEVEKIRFVAADGKDIPAHEAGADVTVNEGSVILDIKKAAGIGTVVVGGAAGVVTLLQDGGGSSKSGQETLTPKDGIIDVRNGTVEETFNIEPGVLESGVDRQEHRVSLEGTSTQVVATRTGQLAVEANDIPQAKDGNYDVRLTTARGRSLSGSYPGWGYNISVPPVTKTDSWVPVKAEVFGLEPDERVTFRFLPEGGQQIKPQKLTMMAAELLGPRTVAKLKADRAGDQAFGVAVEKE
ncbi:MAG: hypothetical protein KGZ25_15005 [Planctomycetes bacterium]|nr:hypothetical protein [Planctomycetota bacterium]